MHSASSTAGCCPSDTPIQKYHSPIKKGATGSLIWSNVAAAPNRGVCNPCGTGGDVIYRVTGMGEQ